MTEVLVRRLRADEFPAARHVAIAAFDGDPQIGELLDLLRASWAWDADAAFVAEVDADLVGYVQYSRAVLDAPQRLVSVLLLSPLGVAPSYQRRGIGSRLVAESLDALRDRPEPLVFLEGHPAFYPRFGFERADQLGFVAPSVRIPPEAFLVKRLNAYRSWMTGRLVYPDAFWRADAVGLRQPAT
jgi:putative acetyltransferase